ncbi:MAG: hypothetical protein HLUCCA12_08395 [Rhodobacteraceae bacterium HLUCCA12]|nr:MAG: hypothetical protein HLUCCA12_08395 [Rhodobacteraceae bacterium HLUCCA12]
MKHYAVWALVAILALSGAVAALHRDARPRADEQIITPNAPALAPPEGALQVYHLGHSLVGRDMPAMVRQLAEAAGIPGHGYHSQLGWGTPLRAHWYPDAEIAGFERENDHPQFRLAHEAIDSGDYDAVVLTEMVELRDAIEYHDSGTYFREWARAARQARPGVRLYLYETWHPRDDQDEWLARLDSDPVALWKGHVLAPSWADDALGPVHLIPAGRVMAAFTRAVRDRGGVDGLADETGLFQRNDDGTLDTIHINDLGNYLVALTHFAVLYHRPVQGLPHALRRADGTRADAPSDEAAQLMQEVVWDVIRDTPFTGLAQESDG